MVQQYYISCEKCSPVRTCTVIVDGSIPEPEKRRMPCLFGEYVEPRWSAAINVNAVMKLKEALSSEKFMRAFEEATSPPEE